MADSQAPQAIAEFLAYYFDHPDEWAKFREEISLMLANGYREVCICAALRTPAGTIIRGHRHNDCLRTAITSGVMPEDVRTAEQGFVTSRNRFVGRVEGQALQRAAGIPSAAAGGYRGNILFSEDLY